MSNNIKNIIYKEEYYGDIHDNSIRRAGFFDIENDLYFGEHITFYPNGKVHYRGFQTSNFWIGKLNIHGVNPGDYSYCYYSFFDYTYPGVSMTTQGVKIDNSPKSIDEYEYKKELVKIRLEMENIPHLSWKLQDFHLVSLETGCGKKIPNYVW